MEIASNQPDDKHQITCQHCGKTALIKKRIPTGWKRCEQAYTCSDCWRERYMLRAIIFPVASPIDLSWQDFRAALKIMWSETTRASNWMVRQLAIADAERDPTVSKMPTMPRSYLYPEARLQFPTLPPQSIAALEQAVTKKYKAKRYEVIWACRAALPTFRYPQPFPVHNQSWDATIENDSPIVAVRIGETRIGLRLKGGSRYRRQLASFRAIVAGGAFPGECSVYEQGHDILVKMVAWLPRRDATGEPSGTLRVRTAADSLLVAVNEKDEMLWTYNADQIPRWAASHSRHLQRWSEDSKFEHRPVPLFAERRQNASLKYHRRINTAADQVAASLVGYARRRKFASVVYDDTEHGFCPDFVWFRLQHRIQTLCDEHHIQFAKASGLLLAEQQGALVTS